MELNVKYKIVEGFEEKEIKITCGSKLMLKQFDNVKAESNSEGLKVGRFMETLELTEEEKEIINFNEGSYRLDLDNDVENVEKFKPVVFNKTVVAFILRVLGDVSVPRQNVVNLSFVSYLIDSGVIEFDNDVVITDGEETVELDTEDVVYGNISEMNNSDKMFTVSAVSRMIVKPEEEKMSFNEFAITNYISTLVIDIEENIGLLKVLFEKFYSDDIILANSELTVIDKYLKFDFDEVE